MEVTRAGEVQAGAELEVVGEGTDMVTAGTAWTTAVVTEDMKVSDD